MSNTARVYVLVVGEHDTLHVDGIFSSSGTAEASALRLRCEDGRGGHYWGESWEITAHVLNGDEVDVVAWSGERGEIERP